jgi:hypothetical protein
MLAAFDGFTRHPPPPVTQSDGSVTIQGPGIAEFFWEEYKPITAIIYGPWLAAWAFLRRSSPRTRRVILLVSIGALLPRGL